jgi:formamidopyrimidine-DNA glycosylase
MPEMPEVEVLVRHLTPRVVGMAIQAVETHREKVLRPTTAQLLRQRLPKTTITGLRRRGKYLLFELRSPSGEVFKLLGHLGMTGRMFLQPPAAPLPKHAAVTLLLHHPNSPSTAPQRFVFEDTRYFGRFTLDLTAVQTLGPEPLEESFNLASFAQALRRCGQAIKVKLLDQTLVAGIGNIYASEALFRAGISPRKAARRLLFAEVARLHQAIRHTLQEAIDWGSTIPLHFDGGKAKDGLFYFGRAEGTEDYYTERLRVYDRLGQPCPQCQAPIRRLVQAARSTYYCPQCQKSAKSTTLMRKTASRPITCDGVS